ncbi:hypothetical protein HHI36_002149, partial [Cryptolaemus montrouzieri]
IAKIHRLPMDFLIKCNGCHKTYFSRLIAEETKYLQKEKKNLKYDCKTCLERDVNADSHQQIKSENK